MNLYSFCLSHRMSSFELFENQHFLLGYLWSEYFTLASTAIVLSEHIPRPGIRTSDLPALSPKVLSIRPPRWSWSTSQTFVVYKHCCVLYMIVCMYTLVVHINYFLLDFYARCPCNITNRHVCVTWLTIVTNMDVVPHELII